MQVRTGLYARNIVITTPPLCVIAFSSVNNMMGGWLTDWLADWLAVCVWTCDEQAMQSEDPHLASFSLSLQPQRGVERGEQHSTNIDTDTDTDPSSVEWQTASATDILVPCFSMTAPGKPLLVDASLRVVGGRRYGVLGSNGCGKSTLLHFLAARRLPIPNGKTT